MASNIFNILLFLGICFAVTDLASAAGTGPKVTTIIRLPNETFTTDLTTNTTNAYANLTQKLETTLKNALAAKDSNIVGLKVNGYSNGSVIANTTVELATSVDPTRVDTAALVKNATTAVAKDSSFTAVAIDTTNITTSAISANATAANASTTTTAAPAAGSTNTTAAGTTNTTTAAPAAGTTNTTTAAPAAGATNATTSTTNATTPGASTTAANTTASGTNTNSSGTVTTTAPTTGTNTTTSGSKTNTTSTNTTTSGTNTNTAVFGSTGTGTGTNSTTNSTAGSSTASGTSSSAGITGSTGTASPTATARNPVNVDLTGLQGAGLLITATKSGLPAVAPYLDPTKAEYISLTGAIPYLNNAIRNTSEMANILDYINLKQVIALDSISIRAEYVVTVNKNISLTPLQAAMDSLNKNSVFKLTGVSLYLEVVPLTAPNRWYDLRIRIVNKTFTARMSDPSDSVFKGFINELEQPLTNMLGYKVKAVRAVYVQEFLSGSVIVRANVETDNTSSSSTITSLSSALSTIDTIGNYNLDTNAATRSLTNLQYIYGAHTVVPVNASVLPNRTIYPSNLDNIQEGNINIKGNSNNVVIHKTNYFFTVTIPSFAAVLALILLFLCCTTADSCLCKICSNDPKSVP